MKTIPFNIELAKQGKQVITRLGLKARIICIDRISEVYEPIVALVYNNIEKREVSRTYSVQGRYLTDCASDLDLVHPVVETKKEHWRPVFKTSSNNYMVSSNSYETKEMCEAFHNGVINFVKPLLIHTETIEEIPNIEKQTFQQSIKI